MSAAPNWQNKVFDFVKLTPVTVTIVPPLDDPVVGDDGGEEREGEMGVVAVLGVEIVGVRHLRRFERGGEVVGLGTRHHVDRGHPPVLAVVRHLLVGEPGHTSTPCIATASPIEISPG